MNSNALWRVPWIIREERVSDVARQDIWAAYVRSQRLRIASRRGDILPFVARDVKSDDGSNNHSAGWTALRLLHMRARRKIAKSLPTTSQIGRPTVTRHSAVQGKSLM